MSFNLKKLFEGESSFTPEFAEQVSTVIEGHIAEVRTQALTEAEATFATERAQLIESHREELLAHEGNVREEMTTKLDAFLESAIKDWALENAPSIDARLKSEAAESFMNGFVNLFKESGINVDEAQKPLVENLTTQVATLQSELAEKTQQLTESALVTEGIRRGALIAQVCEGLAMTEIERVTGFVEGISAQNEEMFKSRVMTFRKLVESKKKEGNDDDLDDDEKAVLEKVKKEGEDKLSDDEKAKFEKAKLKEAAKQKKEDDAKAAKGDKGDKGLSEAERQRQIVIQQVLNG